MERPLLPVLGALMLGAALRWGLGQVDLWGEDSGLLELEARTPQGPPGSGSPGPWVPWLAVGLGLLGVLWFLRLRRTRNPQVGRGRQRHGGRRAFSPRPWQGVPPGTLLALAILVGLQPFPSGNGSRALQEGPWQTHREGEHLVGDLGNPRVRFELPPGSVKEGEWVELSPTMDPKRPAVGKSSPHAGEGVPILQGVHADEIRRHRPASTAAWPAGPGQLKDLRKVLARRLEKIRDPGARGLARALVLGDRSALVPGTADLYTRTGTRHALAVSGLHVGLVACLWIWPLGAALAWILARSIPFPRIRRHLARPEWVRILLLLLFIPVAGGGAPVLRASVALCLTQVARLLPARGAGLWVRRVDALSLWAFAAVLEACSSPESLRSISMQLSYTATLGLILFTRPLLSALRRALPGNGQVQPVGPRGRARSPWLRLFAQRALDWTLGALCASVAASVATLPIVWSNFGEWSWVGPLATLWLLPWLALFLGLAWLLLLFPTDLIAQLLSSVGGTMEAGLHLADGWPATPIVLPLRPEGGLFCLGVGLFLPWLISTAWRPRIRRLTLCGWALLLLPWTHPPQSAELYLADVGHGTAAVMRLPGAGVWLFDGGSRDRVGVGRRALFPLLRSLEAGEVHYAVSHGERDHAGALPWIAERFPPGLWLGALPRGFESRMPEGTRHVDLPVGRTELTFRGPRGARVDLALLRGLPGDGNEGSRSLEITVGRERWLLCGDAEGVGLARQLRTGLLRGPYDLVLFPHHGSETPWLGEFLAATEPGEIWFSCSGRPPVADELDRRGIPWASTAQSGPLERRLDPP